MGHVKAQTLADFIMELTPVGLPTVEDGEWFLSVDGSSNQTESRAGIILEGPNNVLIKLATTYEALLASMRLARELEAKKLTTKSDSKLVIRQVLGASNKDYNHFQKIHPFTRTTDQNVRADLLSKLASTQKRGQQKLVTHESLSTPTVDK
ncbi:hypothetical protein CR513_23885, partial [Mucuna pruriens]